MPDTREISLQIYRIIANTNQKLLKFQSREEKKKIISAALKEIQKILKNIPVDNVSTVMWNLSNLLSQDFGALLYDLVNEFKELISDEKLQKSENTFIKMLLAYCEGDKETRH